MKILLILLPLILAVSTEAPPGELNSAEEHLARREYADAIRIYQDMLGANPSDTTALKGLANVYTKMRDWDRAGAAWQDLLRVQPYNSEAMANRWFSLVRGAGGDSVEVKKRREEIEKEVLSLLERREQRESAYSAAHDGLRIAGSDSARIREIEALIVRGFPESSKAYEIASTNFYEGLYPIWTNDTLKVDFLVKFLEDYPVKDWRLTVYQFMLSSLRKLEDVEGVRKYGKKMIAEDSLDPFAHDYLSYILLDMGIDTSWALDLAEKAVRLEPGYEKPVHKAQEQWELDKEPLAASARRNAATALMALGRLEEAEARAREAIGAFVSSLDNFATAASLHYTLGKVLELKGDSEGAMLEYVEAVVLGDMTGRWSARADSSLQRIYPEAARGGETLVEYARRVRGYSGATFTDVTKEMGLAGRTESRVAWADFNNDGFDDLILNGRTLLMNDRGSGFRDCTASSGIAAGASRGAVCADFDNDGNMDFYAISGGQGESGDKLWQGKGDGTFVDATPGAGVIGDTLSTEGAGWADYDSDGLVDLYCANYEIWQKAEGLPDFLYHNEGHGVFSDATRSAGLVPPFGEDRAGRGVNWGDFDNDGDADIYVSNYRLQENFLYRNNGDGTFTNVAALLGVAGVERDGWWGHTIGSEWGDFDNDGDLDLVTANLAHPRYIEFSNKTMLYENTGAPDWRFVDRRKTAGIKYDETHSDPSWGDIDADGDLDLYITSIYEDRRSFLYENLGGGRFREITWPAGVRVLNGWGCSFSDYDNDGDLDLFVASGSGCRLYRNDGNGNRWLEVKVEGGGKTNRAGIGARVTVTKAGLVQTREVEGGKGTTSQHSLVQFFGFGKDRGKVLVRVRFSSGKTIEKRGVSTNQRILVKED